MSRAVISRLVLANFELFLSSVEIFLIHFYSDESFFRKFRNWVAFFRGSKIFSSAIFGSEFWTFWVKIMGRASLQCCNTAVASCDAVTLRLESLVSFAFRCIFTSSSPFSPLFLSYFISCLLLKSFCEPLKICLNANTFCIRICCFNQIGYKWISSLAKLCLFSKIHFYRNVDGFY